MPTISASDVLALISQSNFAAKLTATQKFSDLVANILWPQMCQCNSGSPTLPALPSAPTGMPQLGNQQVGVQQFVGACVDVQNTVVAHNIGFPWIIPFNPNFPAGGTTLTLDPAIAYQYVLTVHYVTQDPVTCPNGIFVLKSAQNPSGTLLTTEATVLATNNGTTVQQGTLTANSYWCVVQLDTNACVDTWTAHLQLWCNSAPTANLAACCPPDPTLSGRLDQILSYVQGIYEGLPTPLHSYALSTVHAGLTGNGSFLLGASCIAVQVTITTDQPVLGSDLGDPVYLFDRGYIVPFNSEGPIYAKSRLVYSPQVFQLPALTDSIGYSLHSGITVTITELVAGP